jgi:hypothetical protein
LRLDACHLDDAAAQSTLRVPFADRFPLLPNLREALAQVFSPHTQVLDAVNALEHQQPVPLPDGALAVLVPSHDIPLPAQQRAARSPEGHLCRSQTA